MRIYLLIYNIRACSHKVKVIHSHFVDANEMVRTVEKVDKTTVILANAP